MNLFAQNKEELLLLQHDGKINLVPRYGYGYIEKSQELKSLDDKFIRDAIIQFSSKDSACKVYSKIGWQYFYKGDILTAMERFNQAWLLDSTNALEYFGFSAILEIIKDKPDDYYKSSTIKIKEVQDPQMYYNIGKQMDINNKYEFFSLCYTSTGYEVYGKIDKALESCNRLIELNPENKLAFKQRGHIYIVKKEWEKGLNDLNLYKEDANKNEYTLNDMGFAYESLGDNSNASIFYDKSSKVNPKYLNPIYNNALLQLKTGQFQLALYYIDRCIAIKDDVGQFYKTKGEILIKLNDKEKGLKFLKKAKKLGDKDAEKIIEVYK